MAEYGNNFDYGESPFYKDDSEIPITDLQRKVRSLLVQQLRHQYGLDSDGTLPESIAETSVLPELSLEDKIGNLLIQQFRQQYGSDSTINPNTYIARSGPKQPGTVLPATDISDKSKGFIIEQLREQYGTG